MKASIVVTTYNRAKLLKTRSLPSALSQSFSDYQVIVVDDGSIDDTEQVVSDFQKNFSNLVYFKHDQNKGLAAARNTGARIAAGEYIAFLDDDDVLVADFLKLTSFLLDNTQCKVVIPQRMVMYPEGAKFQRAPYIHERMLYTTLDDGFLIRKEVFDTMRYDETLLTNEDADFGLQFVRTFGYQSIGVLHEQLLLKYGHAINAKESWSTASERTIRGMELYLQKNLKYYYEHGDPEETEYILRMMGRLCCQGGRIAEGIGWLIQAFREKPMLKNALLILFAFGGQTVFNKLYGSFATKARQQ